VQADSPALAAGIGPGDVILKVDGQPVGDPMTLPDRLNTAAGKTVQLTISGRAPARRKWCRCVRKSYRVFCRSAGLTAPWQYHPSELLSRAQ